MTIRPKGFTRACLFCSPRPALQRWLYPFCHLIRPASVGLRCPQLPLFPLRYEVMSGGFSTSPARPLAPPFNHQICVKCRRHVLCEPRKAKKSETQALTSDDSCSYREQIGGCQRLGGAWAVQTWVKGVKRDTLAVIQ